MANRIDVFYAFPGSHPSLKETIEQALQELKESQDVRQRKVRFKSWTEMSIGGKTVLRTITDNIDRADLFACDLTYLNFNVVFELGYAIGRFKRIWISLNPSIEGASKNYNRVLYTAAGGLGYVPYANRNELISGFVTNPPWKDLEVTPLGKAYRNQAPLEEFPSLLYLKPSIDTDAVIGVGQALTSSRFGEALVVDDPKENLSPTLEWYADKIRAADAVLVQLLADNHRDSHERKMTSSFVAGLAHAFGKPLLLVAETPFDLPVDYQTLLKVHETASQCVGLVQPWISEIEQNLPRRRARRPSDQSAKPQSLDLRKLSVGEPRAEHERRVLDSYFVETSAYYHALESSTTIVVGRRGTGKTANLFAMQDKIGADKGNHVCVIKPVGYEVDGLVRVLSEIRERSERGNLVDSLWQFLLFSELALSVFNEIKARPDYSSPSAEEMRFLDYVTAKSGTFSPPFSERLDKAVKSLFGIGKVQEALQQRARISELLHTSDISDLRVRLGAVLGARKKVAILVDNLDEPWGPGRNVEALSELLTGLVRVAVDMPELFSHQDSRRKRVNLTTTVFLRSDIFAFVQPLAAEEDKLPIQRIYWDDFELLLKLLYQRLEYAAPPDVDGRSIWNQMFPEQVVGVTPWDFITRTILPRPRDVIYIVRAAIDGAVNRGHRTVTADDLLAARRSYSEFAFSSIRAEDDPRKGKLEAVLYEFAGAPSELGYEDVCQRMAKAGVEPTDNEFYIDLLCDVNFLGVQGAQGFRYPRHEGERRTMRQVAKKLATERGQGGEIFEINAAFHQVLQIG